MSRWDSWQRDTGRSSKTLAKYPDFHIVLVLTNPNTQMSQHHVDARISIHSLQGRIPSGGVTAVTGTLLAMIVSALSQRPGATEFKQSNRPVATAEAEKKIFAVLDETARSHRTYLSVPAQDGRALRLLTEAVDAKNAVEIGTSTGYSGLWFCLALQRTKGHLTTFEIDHQRASMAREHFKQAGVESSVTVLEGDAHEQLSRPKPPVDIAFIDADKTLLRGQASISKPSLPF